ncbi:tether containing UBX domain for GLUT4 isoform X2 [Pectinophora gossypiella]|uniref:TUG ubiquitin-like domain-containing protein n=4 Tax=Pectinophora gossypiella TaxID=13191 RepID=A0A1E1WBF7_PECGO|nr:tether containing UBX domain for GLUT4 isoform X2 [Pectinophora gossypiella]
MSKDIIVLTPNGRRQKIQCSPDTIILQVLEDVCAKQGFEATAYDLKHHNTVLDLTTTVRFSNLPNKATLEMVEAEKRRQETTVTIGLLLEDGDRRTADFPPNTSLYELITSLAPSALKSLENPTILYMRQEVTGVPALKEKTLRKIGLLGGRAILRLLNKAEDAKQANVSAVYRRPPSDKHEDRELVRADPVPTTSTKKEASPGPSAEQKTDPKQFDPITMIKAAKQSPLETEKKFEIIEIENKAHETRKKETGIKINDNESLGVPSTTTTVESQEKLERRLKIEEEVTFLGAQKAIAFMQPDSAEDELSDLPDDFYELTIEEVRKLYKDLQEQRLALENEPLITSAQKQDIQKMTSEQRLAAFKNVVVRVQFPDNIILQGIFSPTNTIGDVISFIKEHLEEPNRRFHIFTTPLKEALDPNMTLLEAKFVPCVHMHFKWLEGMGSKTYLKGEIYTRQTSSEAASMLASKYRASRRKIEESPQTSQAGSSTSKSSKLPKWFKR